MIIDCHVHVKGGDRYRREFSPDLILQTMDEAEIDRSVIFSICLPSRESNELTRRCYEAAPDRFIPFAHVLPEAGTQPVLELQRAIQELGFKGLKLHLGEMDEPAMEPVKPICAAALDFGIPVLIDFAGRLDVATELVSATAGLNIIAAHLGSPSDETTVDKFIGLAHEHESVYLDTSYSACPWMICRAIERLGTDRVIFGSDGPLIHPAIELTKIRVCKLSDEDFRKVTCENIEGLVK